MSDVRQGHVHAPSLTSRIGKLRQALALAGYAVEAVRDLRRPARCACCRRATWSAGGGRELRVLN
ncbi:MAG: hypothetical protein ACRDWI_12290 [Jiangellaceae bacterium]